MSSFSTKDRLGKLGPDYLPQPLVDSESNLLSSPLNWRFDPSFRLTSMRNAPIILNLNSIKGVVFDNDGLLVNSEKTILSCIFRAAEEMIRQDQTCEHFSFSPEEVALIKKNCFGKSEKDMAFSLHETIIAMGHGGPGIRSMSSNQFFSRLIEERIELYTEALRNGEVSITPGVEDLLRALHQNGVVVALCTGNAEPFITPQFDILFKRAGLPEIDSIIPPELRLYGDSLPKGFGKPNPFPYERIAARIRSTHPDILPRNLAFAEDRLSGLVSGLSAGYGRGIYVAENGDFAQVENPLAEHSFPRLMSYCEKYERELKDPSRVVVVGGLDRIVLRLKEGGLWLPPYYQQHRGFFELD